jgi:hypothetical protein
VDVGVSESSADDAPYSERREQALAECERLRLHFAKQGSRHKSLFQWLKYSSIGLTVGVTVLAAFPSNPIPWVLPVVAGLAAFCTAMLSATHAQELWVVSRAVQKHLQAERFQYLQGAGRYRRLGAEERLRLFSERVMEVWSGGHEGWEAKVAEKSQSRGGPADPAGSLAEPAAVSAVKPR